MNPDASRGLRATSRHIRDLEEELDRSRVGQQRTARELVELRDDMTNLLGFIDVGTIFLDGELRTRAFTPAATLAFALDETNLGRAFTDVAHRLRDDPMETVAYVRRAGVSVTKEVVTDAGAHVRLHVRPYRAREARRAGVMLTVEDVTERARMERAHDAAAELFKSVFDHARIGMALAERSGRLTRVNHALCSLLGREGIDLVRGDVFSIVHEDDRARVGRSLERTFGREEPSLDCECRLLRAGAPVWVHLTGGLAGPRSRTPTLVIGHFEDITARKVEEHKMREITATLESEANKDPLTSLLNRRGLEKELRSQINQSRRAGTGLVAILVDCDDFKQVNDVHGHAAGDAVLREVAARLRESLRPSDWVARIGGDEFLVLLPDTRFAEGLHVAEKLRRQIADRPIATEEARHRITASFGAASVSRNLASIEEILRCTHDAISRSKLRGKNRVQGSAEHVRTITSHEAQHARREIRSGTGLRTVVQPIWDLRASTVIGFEMLSRGPKGALEKPADLFRFCSDTRALTEIDLRCLERALRGAARLEGDRRVHVNLFPSTIMEAAIEPLADMFLTTGAPERFCLEISEQQLVGDPGSLQERTSMLKSHGIEIAVDDVGFGRSSLETLIVLEPDVIKIDRSMVTGVSREPGLERSLRRLLRVSHGLGARLIAEGIETREDRVALLDMGVTVGQGFLWGKPYTLA